MNPSPSRRRNVAAVAVADSAAAVADSAAVVADSAADAADSAAAATVLRGTPAGKS